MIVEILFVHSLLEIFDENQLCDVSFHPTNDVPGTSGEMFSVDDVSIYE